MKKIFKKMKIIYKKSEIIIDFIYKIIFSIISIFILLNTNKLTREQVELNKELTSPTFIISQESYNDDKIKIKNLGGKVSHLFIERIDEIYVKYRHQKILVSIKLYNNNISTKNKILHFVPSSKKYDYYELYHKIDSNLKGKSGVEYVFPNLSYYKITYMDYKNVYHQDYYELYGNEGRYVSSNEFNKRKFAYRYDFFVLDDDYLNETYEKILYSLNKYIDYSNNKLRITTQN